MLIHRIQIQLSLPAAQSLKDKRSELNRIKDYCRSHFNVSLAESNFHDLIQTAEITLIKLSFKEEEGYRLHNKIEDFIESHCSAVISFIEIETI